MEDASTKNPFTLLGFEPRYEIDADAVERAYRERLGGVHPDAGGADAAIDAAALNEARDTLLDDERRAVVLLSLLGGPGSSQCKDLPEGFLAEMMTRREQIETQIQAKGEGAREFWEVWAHEERSRYRDQAAAEYAALPDDPSDEQLRRIRVTLNAWRYIERLIEQLDPDYDPGNADFA